MDPCVQTELDYLNRTIASLRELVADLTVQVRTSALFDLTLPELEVTARSLIFVHNLLKETRNRILTHNNSS